MIDIYYCEISEELTGSQWEDFFSILPPDQKERNNRFKKWEDRHSHLFGRLLLQKGLVNKGYAENILSSIQTTGFDKPYINEAIDFSISHSKNYVICAISEKASLGIDIEKKDSAIDITQIAEFLSPFEKHYIDHSINQIAAFYRIWTRKESLIKANGKGFSLQLNQINCLPSKVSIEMKTWYIRDVNFSEEYAVSISTSVQNPEINYLPFDFYH